MKTGNERYIVVNPEDELPFDFADVQLCGECGILLTRGLWSSGENVSYCGDCSIHRRQTYIAFVELETEET